MKTKEIIKTIPLWKQEKMQYVKKSTYSNYCVLLEKHIMPLLENNEHLNSDVVQKWCYEKIQQGLSVKTIKCVLIVLNNIIKYGAEINVLKYEKVCVKFPKNTVIKQPEILTKQQHKKILNHILSNFSFKNIGIYICLSCGLRIGEVCALTWGDIDINKRVIKINKTVQRVYSFESALNKTEILVDLPKTVNSVREIPISAELVKLFKGIINFVESDCYLLSNSRKPIEPRSYRNYYKKFMQSLEMPIIKFHNLRHSFATRCIESNCDYKTLSCLLGHSNITTTLNLYAHPNLEQKRKCVNKMLRMLG